MLNHSPSAQQNKHQYSSDLPGWVWRAAWAAFFVVVGAGAVLAILLSLGVADPPRAGGLTKQLGPFPDFTLDVGTPITEAASLDLPAFPYSLEVTARLTANIPPQDLYPAWEIVFDGSPFTIRLYRERYFAVLPALTDTTSFIHIRPAGESNKIYLDVKVDGQGVLRINDEVAWQGQVPRVRSVNILVESGKTSGIFSLQQVALYAPAD